MEIKNKEDFKAKLQEEVAKHVKQFPIYFYGNILINLAIVGLIIAVELFSAFSLAELKLPNAAFYGLVIVASLLVIFRVTGRDFLKNIRTLNLIRVNRFNFGIDEYELDNTLEFIEQLPMEKEEVERMKIELSFGKIIELLDLFNIIACEKGVYDLDIIFRHEEEYFEKEKLEMLGP